MSIFTKIKGFFGASEKTKKPKKTKKPQPKKAPEKKATKPVKPAAPKKSPAKTPPSIGTSSKKINASLKRMDRTIDTMVKDADRTTKLFERVMKKPKPALAKKAPLKIEQPDTAKPVASSAPVSQGTQCKYPISPNARRVFSHVDQVLAAERMDEALQLSLQDPTTSFWACTEWRGQGKDRMPFEWRGYVNGMWCMTVHRNREGVFHARTLLGGQTLFCAPQKTGQSAQRAAYERYLTMAPVPEQVVEGFAEAFNRTHRPAG